MSAILTSTPEGAKLKKALLASALYAGHICLERRRSIFTEEIILVPFHEITHYFSVNMGELGMIGFADSPCETILIHDPPRLWSSDSLAKAQIISNGWKE